MSGRLLAIGDIHGCDTALRTLLQAVNPQPADTLVVLGDVVDRGPGVRQCIDLLIDLQPRCQLVFLMGNHEEMMLNAAEISEDPHTWVRFGGRETMQSYGDIADFDNVPPSHWTFLKSGRDYYAADHSIFVHANLEPGIPLDEQSSFVLRWHKMQGDERPFEAGRRVICGHTAQRSGRPLVFPGWVCIDTCCYGGQWLTALNVQTDEYWQSNEGGALRGPLSLVPR